MKTKSKKCFRYAACCVLALGVCLVFAAVQVQAVPIVVQNRNPADLSVVGLIGTGTPTSGTSTLTDVGPSPNIEYNNLGFRSGNNPGGNPDNWLYAVQLYSGSSPQGNYGIIGINPATGLPTSPIGVTNPLPDRRLAAGDVGGINDNTMYIADDEGISSSVKKLYTVDLSSVTNGVLASGSLSVTTDTISGGAGTVFDYAYLNGFLYGGDQNSGQLARIDLSTVGTGAVARTDFTVGLPTTANGSGWAYGAAWVNTDAVSGDPDFDSVYLYRNGPATSGTYVGDSIFRIDNLSGTPSIGATWKPPNSTALTFNDGTYVPEGVDFVPIPGAVWLLGSGLIGLVAIRRKRSVK